MPPQFYALLLSALLGLIYLSVHGLYMRRSVGFRPGNSNRDNDPPLDLEAQRSKRAFVNYLESWPVFIAISTALAVAEITNLVLTVATAVWLLARAAYLPAYILGFGRTRSLIWVISIAALFVLLLAAWIG